jgi:hypothetical protein
MYGCGTGGKRYDSGDDGQGIKQACRRRGRILQKIKSMGLTAGARRCPSSPSDHMTIEVMKAKVAGVSPFGSVARVGGSSCRRTKQYYLSWLYLLARVYKSAIVTRVNVCL